MDSTCSVVTFFSKLNKSDFSTLTVLSELSEQDKFKDSTQFLAISRDGEKRDVERFIEKFQDKFMAELQAPNGDAGVTVKAHFPLGFDAESKVNKEFKAIAKKAVIGVGFTFIIDQEGVIRWYEQFVRGVNPMAQFETQLENIVNKTALVSNGKMPELEEEEEEELEGGADIDIDPFGKSSPCGCLLVRCVSLMKACFHRWRWGWILDKLIHLDIYV